MEWSLPEKDRTYLRELARKQAEYAALPVMAERRQMWYDLNDRGAGARPPFIIETWTFDRDFMPNGVHQCESDLGRGIEHQLLCNVRNHELINDDKVIPDHYNMGWFVEIDELGVRFERTAVKDATGVETGYQLSHPIKDLKRDLEILKPPVCKVNREKTMAWKAFLEDLLGDHLQVVLQGGVPGCRSLTQRVVHLMGMEAFFMAMYDSPDELHQLMSYLRDNALTVMRWAEQENLLRLNNTNHSYASSFQFSEKLPAPGYDPEHVRLADMWGGGDSQETVGVSAAMFHEFCFPYYRDVLEPLGLVYFGCCEPAHPFWDDISKFPHLKKVSISRWCDEKFMGEALKDTDIVYSRKPDPNFLSVDQTLNEDAWADHIRTTLAATPGVAVEFIVRDVYTVHGNLNNARRAVDVARRVIDECRAG